MNATDIKMMRANKRNRAIAAGALAQYRMAGKTIQPKKGKGVAYKRPKNGRVED